MRKTEIRNQKLGIRDKVFFSLLISYFSFLICYFCFISTSFAQDTIRESLSDLNRMLPAKKIVNVPWGRDPFVPLTVNGVGIPANLKLTAIIYNDKKPSAILNNRIIYEGDSIDGQKVVDITKQYVILRSMSGSYKLEIGNTEGHIYDIRKSE